MIYTNEVFRSRDPSLRLAGVRNAVSGPALARRLDVGDDALRQVDDIDRRIDELARRLNVLGHFDSDGDRPRAA